MISCRFALIALLEIDSFGTGQMTEFNAAIKYTIKIALRDVHLKTFFFNH